jgi:ABC-type multidrug transport system fused ATPase/permease subunit
MMRESLGQALFLMRFGDRKKWVLLAVLALIVSGLEMVGALLVYSLLGLITTSGGSLELPVLGDVQGLLGDGDEQGALLWFVAFAAAFFVVRAVVQVAVVYVQQRVTHSFGAALSSRLVEGYLRLPYVAHLQRNSSELVRNGHQAVRDLVVNVFLPIVRIGAESVLALGLLTVLLVLAPAATALAVLVVGGSGVLVVLLVQPRLRRLGAESHRSWASSLSSLQQSLHGIRDIKLFGLERVFGHRYSTSRVQLARASYRADTLVAIPRTVIETALIGFILLFFGITLVQGGPATEALSVLGLFAYAGLRLQPSVQRILHGLNELKFSAAPLQAVATDLREVEGLSWDSVPSDRLRLARSLRLEAVSFRYEGANRDALNGAELQVRPGEVIGICGPTGGGKTTLVDIISGLLVPSSGRVTVDGTDVRDATRSWQANLGVVPQMVFLLDGSLRANIALGVPDAEVDEEALREVVHLAQLDDYVASLDQGLDTQVGERGVRISGGQRQRIAIARALYRRPQVLIFDEGTSALDNVTEAQLMAAIERLRGDRTILLVAHRLSTVRNSDRIVLVEGGHLKVATTLEALSGLDTRFDALVESEPPT